MGKTRKSYSADFKLKACVRLNELGGNVSQCATELNVSRREIQRWRGQEDELRHLQARTKKGGKTMRRRRHLDHARTAQFADLEEELLTWVKHEREQGHAIHGKAIRKKAIEMVGEVYDDDVPFKASSGWLSRFLQRNGLVSCRVTTQGQGMPANAAEAAKSFMKEANTQLPLHAVGNMDESPFWFDLPSAETYDFKGLKTIKSRTTGHEKLRFTVVLTALANGVKLKPFIIFKGLKKVPKGDFPPGCAVAVAKGGSMTSEIFKKEWCEKVWRGRPGSLFRTPAALVLDRHRSHTHETSVSHLDKRHNTRSIFIPGGMTSVLQPCDVVWNKPMKDRVREKWNDWMANGEQQFTRTGKRKRASYIMVTEWVVDAWQSIPREMITLSFEKCGITGAGTVDLLHSSLRHLVETGEALDDEVQSGNESDYMST